MKTDINIQQQIEKTLESNLLLQGSQIEVFVKDGEAILTGRSNKYYKKDIAKKIAKEVDGVRLIVEEISIVPDDTDLISDPMITSQISEKFEKNFGAAYKDIKIIVRDGYVWLEGRLKWKYQKELAADCIKYIDGIKAIDNDIFIPETVMQPISEKDVLAAIYGDQSITSDIKVEVIGQRIILRGCVENTDQKNLVTRLVRNVAGVIEVENFLSVNWNGYDT